MELTLTNISTDDTDDVIDQDPYVKAFGDPDEPISIEEACNVNDDEEYDAYLTTSDPCEEVLSIEEIIQKNISKNVRDLRAFLLAGDSTGKFITEKGDQSCNFINISEKKTYKIPPNMISEFYSLFEQCRCERMSLSYAERQETQTLTHSGIMIDLDVYQHVREQVINENHLSTLTKIVIEILTRSIDFSKYTDRPMPIRVFYTRKPEIVAVEQTAPTLKPEYKDGFHMLIPEIMVTKGMKKYLIQELVANEIVQKIFRNPNISRPDQVIDKMSCSVPVQLFGSTRPGRPPYVLYRAFDVLIDTETNDADRRRINVAQLGQCLATVNFDTGDTIRVNLAYELSLATSLAHIDKRPTWLRKQKYEYRIELETKIQLLVEKTSRGILDEEELLFSESSVDILALNNAEANYLKELLGLLTPDYTSEYKKWFEVICAIAHTSTAYKPLAIWFSQRRPESWNPSELDRVWNEATRTQSAQPVTKRSIQFWARTSSPQAFMMVEKNYYQRILSRAVFETEGRIEHGHAAKVMNSMIGNKFAVDVGFNEKTGRNGYCWFEFVTPGQNMKRGEVFKWRKEVEPDNIHLYIGEHLPKIYEHQLEALKTKKEAAKNEGEAKFYLKMIDNFKLSKVRLNNDGFQTHTVKQALYRFRNRGFYDELDSYEDIIGVGNGILKLGPKPVLIKGFHEYKISKYTETDYVPFNPNCPYVKDILKCIRDIFPEPDVSEFALFHQATGLDFKESACIIWFCVGGGRNGKSAYSKLTHNTLGNMYCSSGKPALLTCPNERGESANSAQMQQKDKRWFYLDEFQNSETVNTARLKTMVSPGWQSGRDLHERQSNFRNTSNPVCFSNFDFVINTTDHGTWRRIYYYKNKVKFTTNPNPNNPYEKLVNYAVYDDWPNDPNYKQAQLSIMAHYYSRLCTEYGGDLKNVPVPTIARETEIFRNRQDTLNKFLTQLIVKSPGSDDISMTTLTSKYIEWYIKNYKTASSTIPTSTDVSSQIENSRISTALEMASTGVYMLKNHRIKPAPEDPLLDGESTYDIHAVYESTICETSNQVIIPNVIPVVAQPINKSEDPFIADLINNVPTFIQKTEPPKQNIEEIDLDSLLSSI